MAHKHNNIIQVKGQKDNLAFYFRTEEHNFKDICFALEEKLLNGRDFFSGSFYLLYPSAPFSLGEERIIDEIMSAYNVHKRELSDIAPSGYISVSPHSDSIVISPCGSDTALIKRGLRSGSNIVVKGNVAVLGDVNMGAELKASGNIIVMGNCRGLLHAGCEGDREAFIVAYRLAVKQVRIAEISAIVASDAEGVKNTPQKISLEGNCIFLTDYESHNINGAAQL